MEKPGLTIENIVRRLPHQTGKNWEEPEPQTWGGKAGEGEWR